jgi:NAD(P)-dependent dehydrogenase (short-subunit alcohol dehydrogenase family)
MKTKTEGILISSIGLILHMLFVAIPKDILRWLNMKKKSIKGQTIVITGGASGIGQRMAKMLSLKHGAKVAIIDVDKNKGDETVERIVENGGIAKAWKCDITNEEAMKICAEEIKNEFGTVDIVICNAAILFFGHMMELSMKQIQRAMDVNVMGTLITIRAFLPDMEERNSGQIVAISSIAGFAGETYGIAYCPTKFAVRGIMECLQMEFRDRGLNGIICTTVCPWFIRTPMILNMGMRPTCRILPFMSINRASNQIIDAILKNKHISFIPFMVGFILFCRQFFTHHMQKAGRSYLNCKYEPAVTPEKNNNNNSTDYKNNSGAVSSHSSSSFMLNNNNYNDLQKADVENTESENEEIIVKNMARTSTTTPENSREYFKLAPLFWYAIILPALGFTFIVWYRPEWIPVNYMPFIGEFAYNLGTKHSNIALWINIGALGAHIGEAVYSLYLCDQLNISHASSLKWFIQTFLVGFASLRMLLKLRDKNRK